MTTDGNISKGLSKLRSVLGDLTNQLSTKRPSLETHKIGVQGFDSNDKLKRPRISPTQFTTIDALKQKALSSIPKASSENKDPNLLDTDNVDTIESIEESAESFHDDKTYDKVNLTPSDFNYENDSDDHYGDDFVMSQSGSMDCNFVPESQESRVFGVEKSSETNKADVCVNTSGVVESVKACTCSFCTKAAHIWLDLNYQDIKARVSATTRIQKEVIMLSERIGRSKATERHGAESSTRVAGLESNLRQHWRSLFQNMAGIWEKEGHQLEASLLPIAELREKLKTELELIATPFEKN